MFFFATLYFQQVLNYTLIEAGLAFLPFTVGIMGGSVLAQFLIARIGLRATVFGGLLTTAVGLALMLRLTVGGDYLTQMLPSMALIAAGIGDRVRAGHAAGNIRHRRRRPRPRLRTVQHLAAVRRGARAGGLGRRSRPPAPMRGSRTSTEAPPASTSWKRWCRGTTWPSGWLPC